MRQAQGTNHRARSTTAVKVAAAGRRAIAAARRTHLGQVRAAVRTQIVESYRRRQELSQALVELRRGITQFRAQLRTRLRTTPPAAALETPQDVPAPGTPPQSPVHNSSGGGHESVA